jgi:hypothetical protein
MAASAGDGLGQLINLRGPRGPERTAKTEELALRLQDISHRFTEFAFEGPRATAQLAAAVWILGQQPDAAGAIILRATSAAR